MLKDMLHFFITELTFFPPNIDAANIDYGGAGIQGTNIIFTNGVEDPWRWASVPPPPSSLPSSSETTILVDCDQCAHCVELYTPTANDAPSLVQARQFISTTVQEWLNA